MNTRRPGFIKRSPCSRTTRIRWQVRHPSRSKPSASIDMKHALQSMSALLARSTLRTEERFQRLCSLMEKLPPWTEWSQKDDALVIPAMGDFWAHDFSSRPASPLLEDQKQNVEVPEDMLADSLIQLNGNCMYLRDMDLDRHDGGFATMFLMWLRADGSHDG